MSRLVFSEKKKKNLECRLLQILLGTLRIKILSGMANSVDPDQTAPRSSLIWVCTVCMYHFVRHFGVRNFRTLIYRNYKSLTCFKH